MNALKLNQDCVRNLLLTIEENLSYPGRLTLQELKDSPRLKDFSEKDIIYTMDTLADAGHIELTFPSLGKNVARMTFNGHSLLDNVRDDKIWAETKNAAAKVAGASFAVLSDIAAEFIKKKVGLS